ncbi:MAG: hypothetical protein GC196_10560 [Hyphomonas sp.]|nr:hypothetical protein [Hyphomonas sp.]
MRLSDEMNFPHPVLAGWRNDFSAGRFDVDVAYRISKTDGRLDLAFQGHLESKAIETLIADGAAMLGCFVTCRATGLRRLIELGKLPGTYSFASGELLETVTIRPIVWLLKDIAGWTPQDVHAEFGAPQAVSAGDIVAMSEELVITVDQAELPALETIFDLKINETLPDGQFDIDLTRERVTILASRDTKHLVDTLRATTEAAAASVFNSLYVPAVMTILTELDQGGSAQFEGLRWLEPFLRRCEKLKLSPSSATAFRDAQRLLELPFHQLQILTGVADD